MSTTPDDDVRALVTSAVPDPEGVPMAAILRRAQARRRARVRAGAATALVLALLAVGVVRMPSADLRLGRPGRVPETVLPLPPAGDVAPEFLRDGTAVFVGHAEDGEVFVVEARSPRYDTLDVLVGWCPRTGTFEEPFGGSRFDMGGYWLGGPSPTGLVPREVQRRGDALHVGARLAAPHRDALSTAPKPVLGATGLCMDETQGALGAGMVAHHLDRLPEAEQPEDLAVRGAEQPTLVVGTIERFGDRPVRVCTPMPDKHNAPNVCGDQHPRLAPTEFEWFSDDPEMAPAPGSKRVLSVFGAFLMTAEDGVLTLHTVLPGIREHG